MESSITAKPLAYSDGNL